MVRRESTLLLFILLYGVVGVRNVTAQDSATFRTWTDITGKYKTVATFVEFKDGTVRLKKESGKTISLPIDRCHLYRSDGFN